MTDFTPAEEAEFIRLLRKIQADNYWIPTQKIWQEVQRTVSRWAVELVITDTSPAQKPRILLSRYAHDGVPEHRGLFHINGGFEKFPESLEESCRRVARDELEVDVHVAGIVGAHKWRAGEHPWGSNLLSLYIACSPLNSIRMNQDRGFFTRDELMALAPTDMPLNHPHRSFALQYLGLLENGTAPQPIALST